MPAIPTIPQVQVRYASLHAIDHTHIIIALHREWQKDVGIQLVPEPFGTNVGADKIVSVLTSGTVDIASGSSFFALAGYGTNSGYVDFGHGDIFQGFGFMVDPQSEFSSVDDLVKAGLESKEAIKKVVQQFLGKKLVTLNEAAIRGFISVALELADIRIDEITLNGFDTDSKLIAEMVAGRADFAVGSAPGRVSLTLKDFVPVLTSLHLAQFANASPNSRELRAVFHDGWATTREYWENNRETIFRFMSMMYRTLRLMVDKPEETIPEHVDFYNSITGATLTPKDVEVIYRELDPFVPYEEQGPWYQDAFRNSNPFHYCNVIGSHIQLWEELEVLEQGKWTCNDVSVALELWKEFKKRESNASDLIKQADIRVTEANQQATELLEQAKFYQEIYNFLDAERFAKAALDCDLPPRTSPPSKLDSEPFEVPCTG